MTPASPFDQEIATLSERLLELLREGPKTAWELKLALKVTHTRLHLALGRLLERGALSLSQEAFTLIARALETPSEAAGLGANP